MSQPWQEASGVPGRSGSGPSQALPRAASAASADRENVAGPRPRESAGPAGPGGDPEQATVRRQGRLTGRSAIAVMFAVFFIGLLISAWLEWGVLTGLSFVTGSVAAAWYTKQRDLLAVAVSPPLLFFVALLCVKALTASGSALLSTVEGTTLTLANVAPWLFAGVLISLIITWCRGLPRCISDLRRDLRPDLARTQAGRPAGGYRPDGRW